MTEREMLFDIFNRCGKYIEINEDKTVSVVYDEDCVIDFRFNVETGMVEEIF